jgi:hypothetical protein
MLEIQSVGVGEWRVTVTDGTTTHHRVRVSGADLARLAQGRSAEDLLRESFLFLLEHEPNTSILATFDLSIISRYFPGYEQEIRRRLGRKT